MPVLADSVPPSAHTSPGSSSSSSKLQGKYIFGSLALVIIFVFFLQKRLEKRKKSEKYAQYSDRKSNKPSLSPHSRDFMSLSNRAARMSFPSALPEKQYPSASGSGSTTRPLQSNDYDPTSISSIMRPTSSSAQQHSSPTYELPLSLERETQQDLTPPHYSSSYPGLGADTAIPTFQEPGQGQGHEDHPFPSPSSQAKNPQLTPPPSKSRILRPPQTTPPPISAGTPKTMNLSANTNTNNISTPSTITATKTSTSRRSSSGSSLLHPDLPDPSIVSLNTTPSGPSRVGGLTIFTNTNTEYGPQQGQGQVQVPEQGQFETQYPITFVPSPTEYTSFEALYSQNPPYYEASSSSFPSETEAATEQIPRRRSYTKSLSNGSEVSGEIIVSSSGIEGQGWRRHTRVFGGGVCRACEESKGWEREELRRSSE